MKVTLDRLFHSQKLQQALRFHAHFTDNQKEAEVAALSSILYPRCANCQKNDRRLQACSCCGVVHSCSFSCRKAFDFKHPNHLSWGNFMFKKSKRLPRVKRYTPTFLENLKMGT